ncbi:MAG: hypothetical protein WKF87_06905 [Chryseolinea sp.]
MSTIDKTRHLKRINATAPPRPHVTIEIDDARLNEGEIMVDGLLYKVYRDVAGVKGTVLMDKDNNQYLLVE